MQRVILPPVRFRLHAPDVQAPFLLRGSGLLIQCKKLLHSLLAAAVYADWCLRCDTSQTASADQVAALEAAAATSSNKAAQQRHSHGSTAGPRLC